MAVFNLLKSMPAVRRDVTARLVNKEANRTMAAQFGQAYFDGPRVQGYGGYRYDGRWLNISRTAAERYHLCAGQHVLDIGCAKGFFVHDLMQVVPGLETFGVDISDYALRNAHPGTAGRLYQANAIALPFPDRSFDAVFAINTIHNLDQIGCVAALQEISRVSKNPANCFVQVDAYRNPEEKALFEAWMLTAKTYCMPDQWQQLLRRAGYSGDYFWTILEFDRTD